MYSEGHHRSDVLSVFCSRQINTLYDMTNFKTRNRLLDLGRTMLKQSITKFLEKRQDVKYARREVCNCG